MPRMQQYGVAARPRDRVSRGLRTDRVGTHGYPKALARYAIRQIIRELRPSRSATAHMQCNGTSYSPDPRSSQETI